MVRGQGLATLVAVGSAPDHGGRALDGVAGRAGAPTADSAVVQFASAPDLTRLPLRTLLEPPRRETSVDWAAATFAERSGSGKGGVYFVEFPGGRAIVVKLGLGRVVTLHYRSSTSYHIH